MQFPSEISYCSYLQYSPRGVSRLSKNSRAFRDVIKNDSLLQYMQEGKIASLRISDIALGLSRDMGRYQFLRDCFGPDVELVPVPRSAPLSNKDALWPPKRICEELVKVGLGSVVAPLIVRTTMVQKADTA